MVTEEDIGSNSLLNGNPEESEFEAFNVQLDTNLNSTSISWADMMEEAEFQQEQCHPQATAQLKIPATKPLHHRPERHLSPSRIDDGPSEAEETDIATRQMSRFSGDTCDYCEGPTSSKYKRSFAKRELEHDVTRAIIWNKVLHKILQKEVFRSTSLRELVLIKSVIREIKDEWYIPNIYTTEEMIASCEGCVTYYICRYLKLA
jgi:hypothetical protein